MTVHRAHCVPSRRDSMLRRANGRLTCPLRRVVPDQEPMPQMLVRVLPAMATAQQAPTGELTERSAAASAGGKTAFRPETRRPERPSRYVPPPGPARRRGADRPDLAAPVRTIRCGPFRRVPPPSYRTPLGVQLRPSIASGRAVRGVPADESHSLRLRRRSLWNYLVQTCQVPVRQ